MTGCSWNLRVAGAIVAFIAGAFFIRQSLWYHDHLDSIVRIPFVFGALLIGLAIIGLGIRLLLPDRPG
jgi:hypothetical protein